MLKELHKYLSEVFNAVRMHGLGNHEGIFESHLHITQCQLFDIMHHLNSALICIGSKRLCSIPWEFAKAEGIKLSTVTFYIL